MSQRCSSLLETADFADYVVECGDDDAVHRGILCGQSEYFERALRSDFKFRNQVNSVFGDLGVAKHPILVSC